MALHKSDFDLVEESLHTINKELLRLRQKNEQEEDVPQLKDQVAKLVERLNKQEEENTQLKQDIKQNTESFDLRMKARCVQYL
jgi:hypothetical protein